MKALGIAAAGGLLVAATAFGQQAGQLCLGFSTGINHGPPSSSYSATHIVDLDLNVLFPATMLPTYAGDHVLEVRVYTPDNHLYESLSVPFSADRSAEGVKRQIPGYPLAMPVRVMGPGRSGGTYQVTVAFPVGGTQVVSNGLYGKWSAEIWVDGQKATCGARPTFTIQP